MINYIINNINNVNTNDNNNNNFYKNNY